MSTIVYALWCGADVDQTVLRGLYLSETEAERDVDAEVVVWKPQKRDLEAGITGEYCVTYRHGWCCHVEEIKVRDHADGAVALPERPYDPSNSLISAALATQIMRSIVAPSPFDSDRIKVSLHETRSAE